MLLDRKLLNNPLFSEKKRLNLTCGSCHQGRLLTSKIIKEKTAFAKACEKEEHYDGREYRARVCHLLICNNKDCGESYFAVGEEFEDYDYEYDPISGRDEMIEIMVFRPLFFTPPLLFFALNSAVPKSINDELVKSFSLFFIDFAASANKVRVCLEVLMDELKIPKTGTKGKELTLHTRLELFEKKNPVIGEQLLSIKLVGNSGSHSLNVERDDVVTAYEIIEHVLDELYVLEYRRQEALNKAKLLASKSGKLKSPVPPKKTLIPPPPNTLSI